MTWRDLVGSPWLPLGRDPSGFDCWGLVRWVYREHYGLDLPDYAWHPEAHVAIAREIAEAAASSQWTRLERPSEPCVVTMATGRSVHHVGVFVGTGVLHALKKSGVVFESPIALRARFKLGYYSWSQQNG